MPRPPASVRSNNRARARKDNGTEAIATPADSPSEGTETGSIEQETTRPAELVSSNSDAVLQGEPRRRRRATPEQEATPVRAVQPPLFTVSARGDLLQPTAEIPPLSAESSLDVGRWWFRSHLEQLNRPRNTIASYMYDLAGFEEVVGPKNLEDVNREDVNLFLTQSQKKSTRKRRLTSLGAFFKYMISTEKILDKDPTDNFFADFIPLKIPTTLSLAEQEILLEAAQRENIRTYLMIYFMVKLGFTRTELLAVQPEHVDITDLNSPLIYVFYEDQRWHKKERKLAASPEFSASFQRYISEFTPGRKLFEMLPQSVNKLVERVARDADISKKVTPQSLRDTFAVEEARSGANSTKLLLILGLAPDPRNRMSVERYVKLASPPLTLVS